MSWKQRSCCYLQWALYIEQNRADNVSVINRLVQTRSHELYFSHSNWSDSVEDASNVDRWSEGACLKTTPWDLGAEIQYIVGLLWSLKKKEKQPATKSKTTNLSLFSGNFTPSRTTNYLFIVWGDTEKTTPERFPKYLLSGLCFCLVKILLLFMSSLRARHILPYQLFVETLLLMSMNFWRSRPFPLDVSRQPVCRNPRL